MTLLLLVVMIIKVTLFTENGRQMQKLS